MSTLGRHLPATLLLVVCLIAAKKSHAAKWAKAPCIFKAQAKNTNGSSHQNKPKEYSVKYDQRHFICLPCSPDKSTLVKLNENWVKEGDHINKVCEELDCNGAMCNEGEACVPPWKLPPAVSRSCNIGKIGPGGGDEDEENNVQHAASQVPIIIGFAIGGIMLAVVVGGIFIGRTRGNNNSEASDVLTTPVSMSYSEWISNHSTGGRGSKGSNLRIQEADLEEGSGSAVPVYNIVYNESQLTGGHDNNANPVNPAVIEVDDDVMQTLGYNDNESEYGGQIYQHHFQDGHFAFPPSQNEERTDNSVMGVRERGDRMSTTSSTMTPTSPESSWDANTTPTLANNQQFSPNQQQNQQLTTVQQNQQLTTVQHNQQFSPDQQHKQQLLNGEANWSDESDCEASLISSPPELILTNNRRNLATVTHVFADVHRDDDFTDARDVIGVPTRPAPLPPAVTRANKRDRLSSSASGEYAIPYGAIKSSGPVC